MLIDVDPEEEEVERKWGWVEEGPVVEREEVFGKSICTFLGLLGLVRQRKVKEIGGCGRVLILIFDLETQGKEGKWTENRKAKANEHEKERKMNVKM